MAIDSTPTTRTLVRLAGEGDPVAREKLFARAYPDLIQAARFRLGAALRSRMDTLDLAQTVYVDAVRDLSHYEYQGKGSFRRWLLAILENKIRNRLAFFRAKRRDMDRDVPLDPNREVEKRTTSPLTRLVAREDRERLERAMDRLPQHYREVIVNRYYLRMPWAEIGAEMEGRSEEAAQMLCKRALARLRTLFDEETPGGAGSDP